MSSSVIDAVYEKGTLRPIDPNALTLSEGQRVRLTVVAEPDILSLASQVYEGLSEEEIQRVEGMALDRSRFFDRRPLP